MSTDIVVVDKPDVMNTYDDILNRPGISTLFFKPLSDYEHFRDADKGSKEYKLWNVMTTERRTEAEIMMDPQGPKGIVSAMPLMLQAVHGLSVGIISQFFESAARAGLCRAKQALRNSPDLMTYAAVDPDSPRYGKGIIFRQTNIPYLKTATKRGRRAVETMEIRILIGTTLETVYLRL